MAYSDFMVQQFITVYCYACLVLLFLITLNYKLNFMIEMYMKENIVYAHILVRVTISVTSLQ